MLLNRFKQTQNNLGFKQNRNKLGANVELKASYIWKVIVWLKIKFVKRKRK